MSSNELYTELQEKVKAVGCVNSLPAARGGQEARFTQPSLHLFLHICMFLLDFVDAIIPTSPLPRRRLSYPCFLDFSPMSGYQKQVQYSNSTPRHARSKEREKEIQNVWDRVADLEPRLQLYGEMRGARLESSEKPTNKR